MSILTAVMPVLVVILLMTALRWSGQASGLAGWLAAVLIARAFYGLTWDVWWVSQVKGLLLSLNVIAILWPALLLYALVERTGGIQAAAAALERVIDRRGLLLIIVAWIFSGLLEGLAGFGIPLAIISPLLVALGVPSLRAVAAAAVGHSWAVTFGSMGIVYQTLVSVVEIDSAILAPSAAILLGCACLLCGLGAAYLLGELRYWREVIFLGVWMGGIQYLAVTTGLPVMGSFLAALAGIIVALALGRRRTSAPVVMPNGVMNFVFPYGLLSGLLFLVTLVKPLYRLLSAPTWSLSFPAVQTLKGWITQAGASIVLHPFTHPGTLILVCVLFSWMFFVRTGVLGEVSLPGALRRAWKFSAAPSLTVLTMVGLSTLMDHSGMTMLIAQTLSDWTGKSFPVISPLLGMLGSFATGSNNNSNVLFGVLQKNIAILQNLPVHILVAAQTCGGSLGSMIAPVKLAIGCSTTGQTGKDGQVLQKTLPAGLLIGICTGLIVLAWLAAG